MKRNELLATIRPSKARKAVEMAMRPNGVTSAEMLSTLGNVALNRMRALHVQGLATFVMSRGDGHVAYHLLSDERLSANGLRAQQLRREAYERMQAQPSEPDYYDADYD